MTTNTRLITLSSHDGAQNNGDYLSSMTFDFREVLRDERTIMYNTISVQSGEFPYSFYNVSELHNTVAYEVLGTTYTMTIAEGNYNANSFITAFTTQFLGGHGKRCTLTIDSITGRFKLTPNDSTFTITLKTVGSTAFRVMGLNASSDHTFSYVTAGTPFDYPANFLGPTKLKIYSDALACNNLDSHNLGANNLVDTISVTSQSFGLIDYNSATTHECYLRNKVINQIDIQIRDELNNPIDFNGSNWSLTLVLNTYRYESDEAAGSDFAGLLSLQKRAAMIRRLKEDHKDAPVLKKLKMKEDIEEDDTSALDDPDLELLLAEE